MAASVLTGDHQSMRQRPLLVIVGATPARGKTRIGFTPLAPYSWAKEAFMGIAG